VDDHGDTRATATPIVPSATATPAKFEVSGDVDWFSFTVAAGAIYEFTCNASVINCDVYLRDAAGTTLVSDTSTSTNARVRYEFNTAGTYYVLVDPTNWSSSNSYTFQLQDLGVDDHGDTLATATSILPSATTTPAKFEVSGDVDWLSFTAEAGHVYEFTCVGSSSNCDVYLTDAAGVTLVSDTNASNTARVRREFNTAGTFYLRVVAASWSTSNGYTFQLQDVGLEDHGDTLATATPITPSTEFTPARFEVTGDVDWFSFTAQAGHIYEFSCTSASINCDVYLTDAAGNTLVSDTASSLNARVVYELNTAGTYYVRAVAASWLSSINYTFRLQDLGVDDHGDTQATATSITPSTTSTPAKLEVSGDADWFSFTASAGQTFDFFCTQANFDCNLVLYDAAGTMLVADTSTNASAQITREFTITGTYAVRVFSGSTASGAYNFRLNDRAVDDHSNGFDGATLITLNASTTGIIEFSPDVDFFAVDLTGNRPSLAVQSGISTVITVYAPDRTTVLGSGTGNRSFTSVSGGGRHYIRVQGNASATGTYSLTVQ
jgi:hypothetical protein